MGPLGAVAPLDRDLSVVRQGGMRRPKFNFMPRHALATEIPEELRRQAANAVDRALRGITNEGVPNWLDGLPQGYLPMFSIGVGLHDSPCQAQPVAPREGDA